MTPDRHRPKDEPEEEIIEKILETTEEIKDIIDGLKKQLDEMRTKKIPPQGEDERPTS